MTEHFEKEFIKWGGSWGVPKAKLENIKCEIQEIIAFHKYVTAQSDRLETEQKESGSKTKGKTHQRETKDRLLALARALEDLELNDYQNIYNFCRLNDIEFAAESPKHIKPYAVRVRNFDSIVDAFNYLNFLCGRFDYCYNEIATKSGNPGLGNVATYLVGTLQKNGVELNHSEKGAFGEILYLVAVEIEKNEEFSNKNLRHIREKAVERNTLNYPSPSQP